MAGQAEMRGDFRIVNEALQSQPFDRVPALAHATSMTCGTAPCPDQFSMLYNGHSDGRGTLENRRWVPTARVDLSRGRPRFAILGERGHGQS